MSNDTWSGILQKAAAGEARKCLQRHVALMRMSDMQGELNRRMTVQNGGARPYLVCGGRFDARRPLGVRRRWPNGGVNAARRHRGDDSILMAHARMRMASLSFVRNFGVAPKLWHFPNGAYLQGT